MPGKRNATKDQAHLNQAHEHLVAAGAACSPDATKSQSVNEWLNLISSAFYDAFRKNCSDYDLCPWIMDTYDEYAIVSMNKKVYNVPFSINAENVVTFDAQDKWVEVEKEYVPVKADDVSYSDGCAVKAMTGNHVGGYLVKFSDEKNTDSTGEFFTKDTDFGFTGSIKSPIYVHHCLPIKAKSGTRRITDKIGEATLTIDDTGVAVDGELFDWFVKTNDDWVSKISRTVKAAIDSGKAGWSSGTAVHLIESERVGNAKKITRWPLGLDATITPRPAGQRQGVYVTSIKTAKEIELDIDEPQDNTEAVSGVKSVPEPQIQTTITKGTTSMEKEVQEKIDAGILAGLKAIEDKKAADEKAANELKAHVAELVAEAVKSANTTPTNAGGQMGAPNLNTKTQPGDSAEKAFVHYCKTGDNSGLRADSAGYKAASDLGVKTPYDYVEGTQYSGRELVPTEVYNKIIMKRNPVSVARAARAQVISVSSNVNSIPIQKNKLSRAVITAEASGTYDHNDVQPFDAATLNIYKFTKNVPISEELLSDSVVDLEGTTLPLSIAQMLANTENYYFVAQGSNSSMPQGAVYGSTNGVNFASASVISAAEVVRLYYTLPQEYRDSPVWLSTGTTEGVVRGLTGSNFQFAPQAQGSTNGFPNGEDWLVSPKAKVFNCSDISEIGTSTKSLAIGNFEAGYVIGERKALSILRDPFSQASNGIINFWISFRVGGVIVNADAFRHGLHPSA